MQINTDPSFIKEEATFQNTFLGQHKILVMDIKENEARNGRAGEAQQQFNWPRRIISCEVVIQEEIKRRLNSGNACYHSVQNLLFSHLL
jgi:hypothetical protein